MGIVGHFRSGKNSRVGANGTNLNMAEWTAKEKFDDLDTNTFESMGFDQGTVGLAGVELGIRGNWDAGKNIYDSPPGLFPQDMYPNLSLFASISDNFPWLFPLARILSSDNGSQVKGLVTIAVSGKSNGPYSRPTGSA